MLKLDLFPAALRFLETLPPKQYRQVVSTMLRLLAMPLPHDSAALAGSSYRRVDSGEYRIIYRVEGDILLIPLIGKRNDDDVYRRLRRLR